MKMKEIQKHLEDPGRHLYCILDGGTVEDLPKQLFKYRLPNFSLFSGDLESDLAHVAPYLVYTAAEHEFIDWVLTEGFGADWGIFVHSRCSLIEMRRHFRSLTNVYDENGNSMIFRFYDPRVLRKYLPTCTTDELGQMAHRSPQ